MPDIRVVAAAYRLDNSCIFTMPPPARHCDLLRALREIAPQFCLLDMDRQGFLLSNGAFCRRKAAGLIAIKSGQIAELAHPPLLYSEDLW